MTITALKLKTSFGAYPACAALRNGDIEMPGVELELQDVPMIELFRRMCRGLEFDISEMTVVTYFAARHYGLPFTAIPVFPSSSVDDGEGIVVNEAAGIRVAKDLEGKRIGMRSYTVTPGVWKRAYLAEQGVDLSKVTWVVNDEEHIPALHADTPANVERRIGADLRAILSSGDLAAGIQVGAPEQPHLRPLFPDARAAGIETFKRTGVYRLIHTIVIKDDVLAAHPWLAKAAMDAFRASKEAWRRTLTTDIQPYEDPLPLGMTATRASLQALMAHAVAQGIIPRAFDIDAIFPGGLE